MTLKKQMSITSHAITLASVVLVVGCAHSSSATLSPTTVEPTPENPDVMVAVSPSTRRMSLAEFQPDLPAVEGAFECAGHEVIGPNTTTTTAAFPTRADTKATIVVFLDSAHKIIRYAERRGPPIRPANGVHSTPQEVAAAASAVRSTLITLDLIAGRAIVDNRGGGRPDQMVFGSVDAVTSANKFGHPMDRAARVLAQCGGAR
jgi:hypothetical protein